VEWFGLPKSLAFNRLIIPTETAIKLNDTYLFGCKFDPFYYLPLRCILIGYLDIGWLHWPYSWYGMWVFPKIPLSLHLKPWPKFTPHNYHWSSQLSPHRHQPLCTDSSRFQRTFEPRCADSMMQIWGDGIPQSKPFCGLFKKNLRKN